MIPDMEGRALLVADLVGTGALALVIAVSALSDTGSVAVASLVVSAALFCAGCVGFGIGFVRAAGRSRDEAIDLAGLFYLTGSAPAPVRTWFLGTWFAQIALAVAAVAVTSPPFAVMAPVYGIGLITWWASAHATFAPRADRSPRGDRPHH